MELTSIVFEPALARRYRKIGRVLAFPSDSAFLFHKSWGSPFLWQHSWVMIPLIDGHPARDIYGCADHAFRTTYQPVGPDFPHVYEKQARVDAYQPGRPFTVRTVVRGRTETNSASGTATCWVVRNPGGEVYPVRDAVFCTTYQLTGDDL